MPLFSPGKGVPSHSGGLKLNQGIWWYAFSLFLEWHRIGTGIYGFGPHGLSGFPPPQMTTTICNVTNKRTNYDVRYKNV